MLYHSIKMRNVNATMRCASIGLVLLIVFLFSFSLIQGIRRVRMAGGRLSEARERLEELKNENEKLKRELSDTTNEVYVERSARDKLGLVREGEMVLVLPPAEVVKAFSPGIHGEDEFALPEANWRQWMRTFGFL